MVWRAARTKWGSLMMDKGHSQVPGTAGWEESRNADTHHTAPPSEQSSPCSVDKEGPRATSPMELVGM